MSRLVDYFVIVSYGQNELEPIDPAELHRSLIDAESAPTMRTEQLELVAAAGGSGPGGADRPPLERVKTTDVLAAVAQIGGVGGPREVEPSMTQMSETSEIRASPSSFLPRNSLSPIVDENSTTTHSAYHHSLTHIDSSSQPFYSPSPQPVDVSPTPTADRTNATEGPPTNEPVSPPSSDELSGDSSTSPARSTAFTTPEAINESTPQAIVASIVSNLIEASLSAATATPPTVNIDQTTSSNPTHLNVSILSPPGTILKTSHVHDRSSDSSTSPPQSTAPSTPRSTLSFTERIYRGKIVDRYPNHDHRSVPFPPGIAMFCVPDDIRLSTIPDMPVFYFFAATGANGVRLYGSCLKFFEPLPTHLAEQVWNEEMVVQENKRKLEHESSGGHATHLPLTPEQSSKLSPSHGFPPISHSASTSTSSTNSSYSASHSSSMSVSSTTLYSYCLLPFAQRPTIYVSKCICLLSTYAFLRPFREFLTELYRLSLTPSPIPIERIVCNFMTEVPLPPLGEIKVQYALNDHIITFARPPSNNPFGFHHFPIRLLFECLDFPQVMLVFECLLCEKRILLLSSKMSVLTIVAETLLALMYPFQWNHVYIPLLPKALIDFLHAPFPFLIGMHSSYLNPSSLKGDILDDLVLVDLDRNSVDLPGVNTKRPPPLPQKEKKKLWKKLKLLNLFNMAHRSEYEQKLHDTLDLAFSNAPLPTEVEPIEPAHSTTLQHLVSIEMNKNQNNSPRTAKQFKKHGRQFSSGLHTTTNRTRTNQTNLISPSALINGATSAEPTNSDDSPPPSQPQTSLFDTEPDSIDYLICSAFFRVFISLFKDYRPYLIFPTSTNPFPDPCFDVNGFLKVQDGRGSGMDEWMNEWVKTQSFRKFIEERTFTQGQSKEVQKKVLFFEESILAKRNRSTFTKKFHTPFLKDHSTDISKTFVAPSPDCTNLPPNQTYCYPLFPTKLTDELLVKPRMSSLMLQKGGSHHGHHGSFAVHRKGTTNQMNTTSLLNSWQLRKHDNLPSTGSSRRPLPGSTTSPEQVVATLWFILFTAVIGEQGPSHASALDTAFQVLINLRNNGFQVEEEIFPCFMFACGSCGVPERAIDVLREMTNSGFQPDSTTYAALLQVFTMNGDHKGAEALASLKGGGATNSKSSSSAVAPDSKSPRNTPTSPVTGRSLVSNLKRELSRPSFKFNNTTAANSHHSSSPPAQTTYYQHPFNPLDPSSPCHSPQPLKMTEIKDSERINMFQLQFEMIFPGLEIQTNESCPECNNKIEDQSGNTQMRQLISGLKLYLSCVNSCMWLLWLYLSVLSHIRGGWTHNSNDYTTTCTFCGERFVARFSVLSKAWTMLERTASKQPSRPTTPIQVSAALQSDQADLLSPDSHALFMATKTLAHGYVSQASLTSPSNQPASRLSHRRTSSSFVTRPEATPPILVEYLSPHVLKKEVLHLLEVRPARYFTSRAFRKNSPALFWNLVWHFTNQALPIDFLLRQEKKAKQPNKKETTKNTINAKVTPVDPVVASLHSSSSPLLDDYERVIRLTRRSGIGRSFGYGSGGMAGGPGAVGISLGSLLRTRDPSLLTHPPNSGDTHPPSSTDDDYEGDEFDYDDDDEFDDGSEEVEESDSRIRPPPNNTDTTNIQSMDSSSTITPNSQLINFHELTTATTATMDESELEAKYNSPSNDLTPSAATQSI